jgi:hypothetical protein
MSPLAKKAIDPQKAFNPIETDARGFKLIHAKTEEQKDVFGNTRAQKNNLINLDIYLVYQNI